MMEQPRCPDCGTVMRDDPIGFRCGGCGHLIDRSAEYETIVMPPEFEGPDLDVRRVSPDVGTTA